MAVTIVIDNNGKTKREQHRIKTYHTLYTKAESKPQYTSQYNLPQHKGYKKRSDTDS